MKVCPACHSVFPLDDDFCPTDGSSLVPMTYGQPPKSVSGNNPTVVVPRYSVVPSTERTQSANFLYLLVGSLGTIVIVAVVLLIWSFGGKSEDKFANVKRANEPKPIGSPASNSTQSQALPNSNTMPLPQAPPTISVAGRWEGDWTSPSGAYLTVVFALDDNGNGSVDGKIDWTLRRTSRPDKISKVGMSAVEYVRGQFDPSARKLTLQGYRKDDPNNVLVMVDSYRLGLSGDGRRLSGSARNGGRWNATINLAK